MTTSLYLAHLNPVTNAHVEIIRDLQSKADLVRVMPVVFLKDQKEINSKSFPFDFEIRSRMLKAVFGNTVEVSRNYTFHAPFSRYLPPVLSPKSWKLRRQIISGVEKDYFTYTGDKAEGYMLKLYRLNPKIGQRRTVSASSVRERMYDSADGSDYSWKDDVPPKVAEIIKDNWNTVKKFARTQDRTVRVVGMKFPKDGY